MSELFKLVGTISVDVTNATQNINNVISVGVDLETKLNAIGSNADSFIGETSGFSKASVWLGNVLTELSNKVWDLGVDFVSLGFKFNASAETYKASIKTMLGLTDEETDVLYEKLYNFAKETPYAMSGVMESAIKLFNVGMNQDDTLRTLAVLGDLAGGNSEKLTRLIKAYTDTMGYGFLRAQERNQFVENEVLLYGLLADYYEATSRGVFTADQIAQMQADKAISDEDVWAALEFATSEEGRYYDYMAVLMETWAGKTEKLGDDLNEAAGAITKPFFNVIKEETIDKLAEVLNKITDWANNNPEILNNLATALSDLATNGLDVLLGGLQKLLSFWDAHQDMFNGMLVILGGLAIKSGHPAAGFALITAGGYNVWDDWVRENQKEFSGLTSDVDLPFIRQQLEYQGKADEWEAYLESWKNARKGEGYSDEDIDAFIKTQFEGYVPLTDTQLANAVPGDEKDNKQGIFELLASFFGNSSDEGEVGQYNDPNFFTFDYDPNYGQGNDFFTYDGVLDGIEGDGVGGSTGNAYMIGALQQVLSSWKSEITAAVKEGATEGVSGITINGYITTGDVRLDKDTIVGTITPVIDLKLGQAGSQSEWG